MSRRDHLFQIIVRCSGHQQVPRERILARDTTAAAVDAAVRELRRTRNTARNGRDFDRWDLYDIDRGRAHRALIGGGNEYGQDHPVSSAG
jgi:hypothetical protein